MNTSAGAKHERCFEGDRLKRRLRFEAAVLLGHQDGQFGLSAFEFGFYLAALADVASVPKLGTLS